MASSMELTTGRLTIRPFRADDGAALYAYLSDPETVAFEPYPPLSREEAEAEAARRAGDARFLAVCLREGALIGNLYCEKGEWDTWEVGYVFHRAYWGRGYAFEALSALLGRLFAAEGAHRVTALCDPLNPRSWRLLERAGMRREGTMRRNAAFFADGAGNPLWKDTYAYALLADEYAARLAQGEPYTGALIKETLADEAPLGLVEIERVELWKTEDAAHGWWAMAFFRTYAPDFPERLAAALEDGPWYVDMERGREKLVVMRGAVYRYAIGDAAGRARVKDALLRRGVPGRQLDWKE